MQRYPDHILKLQDLEGFIELYYEKLNESGRPQRAYNLAEEYFHTYYARYRFASYESFRVMRDRHLKAMRGKR